VALEDPRHSEPDAIEPVGLDTTRTWVASAPADLVEYVEWKGYYHELFNEPMLERRKVFDKMEKWLQSHSS